MRAIFSTFLKDEAGATAIEYSLIAAFIGLVIIGAAISVGTELNLTFTVIDEGLKGRPQ